MGEVSEDDCRRVLGVFLEVVAEYGVHQ
jgi:hypothetical protein